MRLLRPAWTLAAASLVAASLAACGPAAPEPAAGPVVSLDGPASTPAAASPPGSASATPQAATPQAPDQQPTAQPDAAPSSTGTPGAGGAARAALTGAPPTMIGQTPPTNGSIVIGPLTIRDGQVTNASSVVNSMIPAFRRCYNVALQVDPLMKGSGRIEAKIEASGAVTSTQVQNPIGLSAQLLSCMSARVAQSQFTPPDSGVAKIIIPITAIAASP